MQRPLNRNTFGVFEKYKGLSDWSGQSGRMEVREPREDPGFIGKSLLLNEVEMQKKKKKSEPSMVPRIFGNLEAFHFWPYHSQGIVLILPLKPDYCQEGIPTYKKET